MPGGRKPPRGKRKLLPAGRRKPKMPGSVNSCGFCSSNSSNREVYVMRRENQSAFSGDACPSGVVVRVFSHREQLLW